MVHYHHLLPIFLAIFFPFVSTIFSDLAADRAALLRLRSSIRGRTLRWNATSPSPCRWEGVTCNTAINRVVSLRLPGGGLFGQIPENTIGSLTELRNLSLRRNSLSGAIPSDLGSCTELQYLYLQENRFSGDIPDGLFRLTNLLRINLARNNFSGDISANFDKLTNLRALNLENNRFSGSLPELNSLPNLRDVNVSFNNLSGPIPSRLKGFSSGSFSGTLLCDEPLPSCPNHGGSTNHGGSKLSGGAIAGIVVGSVFGLFLALLIIFILWRKCRNREVSQQNERSPIPPSPVKPPEYDFRSPRPYIPREDHGSSNGFSGPIVVNEIPGRATRNVENGDGGLVFVGDSAQMFSLDELLRASAEVLGKGIVGTTYKAYVETGDEVVVKRVKNVCISEEEYTDRIEVLGAMKHENLVPVRGYFYGKEEKLIIFESMPMGSLHSILHENRGSDRAALTWVIRCRIAYGTASGIEYLHSLRSSSSHGNIKSSNIFLKQYYDACVSEYCITRLVSPIPTSDLIGYKAPEVVDSRKVSQKADVYSFGVLLLELLTGKQPRNALQEEGIDLPRWVKSVVKERWSIEVFDPELLRHQNFEEQMVQLLNLAISCTSQHPDRRPSMHEITMQIKNISGVPVSD
ncbi:probable inactive receptor kinase At1g48480 [Coffea eugenioides]|uniref:probable inactive receptor kinase At1g48480 n=1 Tax=Coffea eugenioides TaxID=49369 RepID=UPI000F609442|nr:probable inactive receptor kinase At1g48480 [Coffea eugenioides]